MLDSATLDRFVELTRARLADGSNYDELLDDFRRHGLEKIDCVRVLAEAGGLSLGQAKVLVHDSPAWADRRAADEHVEDMFFRVMFIECLVGNGQVDEPDSLAAEYRERQLRASSLLHDLSAGLAGDVLVRCRAFMAENLLGRAFAALVDAGHGLSEQYWAGLAEVADTLCLNELLGDGEPDADADDFVRAAYVVRLARRD